MAAIDSSDATANSAHADAARDDSPGASAPAGSATIKFTLRGAEPHPAPAQARQSLNDKTQQETGAMDEAAGEVMQNAIVGAKVRLGEANGDAASEAQAESSGSQGALMEDTRRSEDLNGVTGSRNVSRRSPPISPVDPAEADADSDSSAARQSMSGAAGSRNDTMLDQDDASSARFEEVADERAATGSESATPLVSPPIRDASPALSAISESQSPAAGPVASTSAQAYAGPPAYVVELANPFISYAFANTALVPADSADTKPFHYVTWPPEELELSWARSRRGDDPDANLPPIADFGYFATAEEVAEAKRKEDARQEKIRARLEEYELERADAAAAAAAAASRGRGKGRGRGRGQAQGRGRGRGRGGGGLIASREASAEPGGEDGPAQPPQKRPRAAKSALREPQPSPSEDGMALYEPEPQSPAETLSTATLARMLLPNDLQTSLPKAIRPHPAAIDPLELPPFYIPTPEATSSHPAPSVERQPAERPVDRPDPPSGAPAQPDPLAEDATSAVEAKASPQKEALGAGRAQRDASVRDAKMLGPDSDLDASDAEEPKAPARLTARQQSQAEARQAEAAAVDAAAVDETGRMQPQAAGSVEFKARPVEKSESRLSIPPTSSASMPDKQNAVARERGPLPPKAAAADVPPPSASAGPSSTNEPHGRAVSAKRPRSPTDEGREATKKPVSNAVPASSPADSTSASVADKAASTSDGGVVRYVTQSTTCLSKKMSGFVRCWQCIARGIGHGCSFMGVRVFGLDKKGRIVTQPLFRDTPEEDDEPDWDKEYTSPMSDTFTELLKTWAADPLVRILKRELKDLKIPGSVRIKHNLQVAAVCDTCQETMLGVEFMCTVCGRCACHACFRMLQKIDKLGNTDSPSFSSIDLPTVDAQRRRKCIAKKRGNQPATAQNHSHNDFVPLQKYHLHEVEALYERVKKWWDEHEVKPSEEHVQASLRKRFVMPSNLPDYDANTAPSWNIVHKTFDQPLFFEVWRYAEPIVLRRCSQGPLAKYTPEWFAETFSNDGIDLLHNKDDSLKTMTMGEFFKQFHTGWERRQGAMAIKDTFRTKPDWPTEAQWDGPLQDLHDEFLSWLPLPDVFHPDGTLNLFAHAPVNAAPSDLTPKLMASWETDAATATTKIQTLDHDLLVHMIWGAQDHRTGKPLRIRYDVFDPKDRPALRDFCYDILMNSQPRGTTMQKLRLNRDDPTLAGSVYLTKKQRQQLFERTGVKPHVLYQYKGDTVMIPAGCPYQVSSWIDHINISIPFLAGSSADRAHTLHAETQTQTKERSLWRVDTLQLENSLLYTFLSSEAWQRSKAGSRRIEAELNWPFKRDAAGRPVLPREEVKRLEEYARTEEEGARRAHEVKKAGTRAYDRAWGNGLSEAECKRLSELAKDKRGLELREEAEANAKAAPPEAPASRPSGSGRPNSTSSKAQGTSALRSSGSITSSTTVGSRTGASKSSATPATSSKTSTLSSAVLPKSLPAKPVDSAFSSRTPSANRPSGTGVVTSAPKPTRPATEGRVDSPVFGSLRQKAASPEGRSTGRESLPARPLTNGAPAETTSSGGSRARQPSTGSSLPTSAHGNGRPDADDSQVSRSGVSVSRTPASSTPLTALRVPEPARDPTAISPSSGRRLESDSRKDSMPSQPQISRSADRQAAPTLTPVGAWVAAASSLTTAPAETPSAASSGPMQNH